MTKKITKYEWLAHRVRVPACPPQLFRRVQRASMHGVRCRLSTTDAVEFSGAKIFQTGVALQPILTKLRHLPVEKIADELTKRKVATPRGGRWHGRTVARLLDRLHLR